MQPWNGSSCTPEGSICFSLLSSCPTLSPVGKSATFSFLRSTRWEEAVIFFQSMLAPLRNQIFVSYLEQCLQSITSARLSWQGTSNFLVWGCTVAVLQFFQLSRFAESVPGVVKVDIQPWSEQPYLQARLQIVYDCHHCQGFVAGCTMIFPPGITIAVDDCYPLQLGMHLCR